eukprot:5061768-Prorocentrum_lima.AAC.1
MDTGGGVDNRHADPFPFLQLDRHRQPNGRTEQAEQTTTEETEKQESDQDHIGKELADCKE